MARPPDVAAIPAIGEPAWLRWALTALALALLALLVVMPLAIVVAEAARAGLGAYFEAITTPDTLAAVKLTLLVALATVPLNMAFGIAAAWAITKYRFPGKNLLLTLIDRRDACGGDFRGSLGRQRLIERPQCLARRDPAIDSRE